MYFEICSSTAKDSLPMKSVYLLVAIDLVLSFFLRSDSAFTIAYLVLLVFYLHGSQSLQ